MSNEFYAHPTATIDPGCQIGDGTKIWHYSHVMGTSTIGRDCALGQNVFVGDRVVIGNRVKVQNNVSIYEGVTLDDDVFCGPSMVFTNVINPRSEIERKSEFLPTHVQRGATFGANCTVLCGISIGAFAFVGAGAVVTKDVPSHSLVVGVPACHMGWACRCGEKLAFRGAQARCEQCGRSFRRLSDDAIEPVGRAVQRNG